MASSAPFNASKFFDEIGKRYQVAYDGLEGQQRSVQWLLSHLSPHSKIVDVGSGTGKPVAKTLADAGHVVTGLDISPVMVSVARDQVPDATFMVGDARNWEPESGDGSLDCVTTFFGLITGSSQDDIRAFFHRVHRWLRPGGVFVYASVAMQADQTSSKWLNREQTCSAFSLEEVLSLIQAAGFVVETQEVDKFFPKVEEAGLCKGEESFEEDHIFVCASKA